jgi:hypothetical protein
MYKRILIFLLLAILLAVPAQRITAKSVVIAFDGYCEFKGEWQEDDYTFHSNPTGSVIHWRNNMFLIYCDLTENRLDGYWVVKDSWNLNANENSDNLAQAF